MSQYRIVTAAGLVFDMDATTSASKTHIGVATDFTLEDGESASDHYVNKPVVIAFEGIITDITSISSPTDKLNTKEYIEDLEALKISGDTFTVQIAPLTQIESCVFTRLVITQSGEQGSRVVGENSLSSF